MITGLLVFLEGILAFLSPCILPMLPVYLIYLSGSSINVLQAGGTDPEKAQETKRKMFSNALLFVLGFTAVFVLLGATATALGKLLASHRQILERISGVMIVLMGLSFLGVIRIPILERDHRTIRSNKKATSLSSFFMGLAFSLGWSPCLGPFLGNAMLLSGQSDTMLEGTLLLFIFSLGIAIPFLLTALLFDQLSGLFSRIHKHLGIIKWISGILLIVVGLTMILGWFGYYARLF